MQQYPSVARNLVRRPASEPLEDDLPQKRRRQAIDEAMEQEEIPPLTLKRKADSDEWEVFDDKRPKTEVNSTSAMQLDSQNSTTKYDSDRSNANQNCNLCNYFLDLRIRKARDFIWNLFR